MKVLAIGAHFDDIELGCGGTLYRHYKNKDEIFYIVVTKSDYKSHIIDHERTEQDAINEGIQSAKFLNVKLIQGNFETLTLQPNKELINYLCKKIADISPDVVYTHFIGDQHLDHQAVAKASMIATRNINCVYSYLPNLYNTNPTFKPNYFVDISEEFDIKLTLLKLFKSEASSHNWEKQLKLYNGIYGFKNSVEYCEPFQLIKQINRRK